MYKAFGLRELFIGILLKLESTNEYIQGVCNPRKLVSIQICIQIKIIQNLWMLQKFSLKYTNSI